MTRAQWTIVAAAACLSASLLISGPLSARDAGGAAGCLGEGTQQLPGTWQIEDRDPMQAAPGEGRPNHDAGPAEESLQGDCALA